MATLPQVLLIRTGTGDRTETGDDGTFGVLAAPGFAAWTLELPWRDNRRGVSCIPTGRYDCAMVHSPRHGAVYWVKGVPGRSLIRIHSGNFAGDVSKGLRSDVQGCILLGRRRGKLNGQRSVLCSRFAVSDFNRAMGGDPFTLEIREIKEKKSCSV